VYAIAVSNNLASPLRETHMSYGITDTQCYLPSGRGWESRLYPHPKQVLDLATPEGYKSELTYVTWKWTGWELNLSVASPTPYYSAPRNMSCKHTQRHRILA